MRNTNHESSKHHGNKKSDIIVTLSIKEKYDEWKLDNSYTQPKKCVDQELGLCTISLMYQLFYPWTISWWFKTDVLLLKCFKVHPFCIFRLETYEQNSNSMAMRNQLKLNLYLIVNKYFYIQQTSDHLQWHQPNLAQNLKSSINH